MTILDAAVVDRKLLNTSPLIRGRVFLNQGRKKSVSGSPISEIQNRIILFIYVLCVVVFLSITDRVGVDYMQM